jgi:hypothetical protein
MGQNKWGLICALGVTLIAGRLVAQEASDNQRRPANAEERIELQLTQPLKTPLEFIEAPLNHIMDVISEEYDIPILFDQAALDAVAQSPETEVNVNVRNVSLRSAMELIFKNAEDLTYVVDNEVLLITTEDEANARLEVRIYRVDDLGPLTTTVLPRRGGGAAQAPYDSLMGVITDCVEPHSWKVSGKGEGVIKFLKPGMYVVLQTRRVHGQIEDLLGEIRANKAAIERQDTAQARAESGGAGENPFGF